MGEGGIHQQLNILSCRLMHMFLSNKNIIWDYWISYSRLSSSILLPTINYVKSNDDSLLRLENPAFRS